MKSFKKVIALLLTAIMVFAMSSTAFADDSSTLSDGTYAVTCVLYKDEACTSTSMGNKGMATSELIVSNNTATFTFKTKKFTYLGMSGYLGSMKLDNVPADEITVETINSVEYHNFKFDKSLALSKFTVGNVFTGVFDMTIANAANITNKTGYLKITSITKQS